MFGCSIKFLLVVWLKMYYAVLGWYFSGFSQLLESYIKNELIEKSQLVHAVPSCEESKLSSSEPRRSASIACGASVFEVRIKVPTWASQVTFSPGLLLLFRFHFVIFEFFSVLYAYSSIHARSSERRLVIGNGTFDLAMLLNLVIFSWLIARSPVGWATTQISFFKVAFITKNFLKNCNLMVEN